MSRTDVHRPFDVQMKDPYNRHRVRVVHGTGPFGPFFDTAWPLYNPCGCWLCSRQFGRRYENKVRRGRWRRLCHDLARTSPGSIEDVDVFLKREPACYR